MTKPHLQITAASFKQANFDQYIKYCIIITHVALRNRHLIRKKKGWERYTIYNIS